VTINGVLDNTSMKELVASYCSVRLSVDLLQKIAKRITFGFSVSRKKL